ncbi:MAG: tetratricopeptide repeat protein [Spirochaetaceae bacterium]|nr:MAG: tetratricopeptide repeat protein [Spirochaetaceae bacterium]
MKGNKLMPGSHNPSSPDQMESINFIIIPKHLLSSLSPEIDPDIPIPCEKKLENRPFSPADLSMEAIIAGMIRVLIYQPDHKHSDYYAKLVKSLRPGIKDEFTTAGITKAKLGDFPVAIEVFQGLRRLFPDCPNTALNLALVLESSARESKNDQEKTDKFLEMAHKAYRDAFELDQEMPEILLNFGYFLLEQQNYEKAAQLLTSFLEHEKDEKKHASVKKMLDSLKDSLKLDTLFKESYDNIMMGKEQEGIDKIRTVLAKNPDFWNGWFLLGWGNRRLGLYPEAKEAFLKALDFEDSNPDLLNELAISCMELGDFEESIDYLGRALKVEPGNTKVMCNLGIVRLKMNETDEAIHIFKAVLDFSPDDPIAKKYLEILEKK